jgi:membrane protein
MVVGFGLLKDSGTEPSDALRQFGVKGALASTINHSSDFHDPGRTAVLLLGVWALLTGARTTARTLRAIHALAWGIPVTRWKRNGAAGLLFLCAVVIAIVCAGLASRARSQAGVALGAGATIAMAAVFTAMWLEASLLLPRREGTTWTQLLPGSIVLGVGFAILQAVTVNWLGPKLNHEGQLYGTLGVSFVVLGWLYVVGRLMVAAPLINAALVDHRERSSAAAAGAETRQTDLTRAASDLDVEQATSTVSDSGPAAS